MTTVVPAPVRTGPATRGPVFRPGDPGFAAEVAPFNVAHRPSPAAVVGAETAADVAAAVRLAVADGRPVAVQATGHDHHGRRVARRALVDRRIPDQPSRPGRAGPAAAALGPRRPGPPARGQAPRGPGQRVPHRPGDRPLSGRPSPRARAASVRRGPTRHHQRHPRRAPPEGGAPAVAREAPAAPPPPHPRARRAADDTDDQGQRGAQHGVGDRGGRAPGDQGEERGVEPRGGAAAARNRPRVDSPDEVTSGSPRSAGASATASAAARRAAPTPAVADAGDGPAVRAPVAARRRARRCGSRAGRRSRPLPRGPVQRVEDCRDRAGRGVEHDPPVAQGHQPREVGQRETGVVQAGHQAGPAGAGEPREHLAGTCRVEAGDRLVGQHELRAPDQDPHVQVTTAERGHRRGVVGHGT